MTLVMILLGIYFGPLMAKVSIFAIDMLRKCCLESNLIQLSDSMSLATIANLAVAMDYCNGHKW